MIMMSYFYGIHQYGWFCYDTIFILKGSPYWLDNYISGQKMNLILVLFNHTYKLLPMRIKYFFPILKCFHEWNFHMMAILLCYCILCLYGLMMVFLNKYTCSVFMLVPQKPYPFDNERNTILCALCGILFHMEIVEGGNCPPHLHESIFDGLGKTASFLL